MALQAVFSDAMRIRLAELYDDFSGAIVTNPLKLKEFKLGIGNVDVNGDPLAPDSTFTDLDSPTYTKALTATDVSDNGAGVLTVVCLATLSEANDTPDPLYTEIGVFTDEDVMVLHGTFGPQVKNSGNSLEFTFTIPF